MNLLLLSLASFTGAIVLAVWVIVRAMPRRPGVCDFCWGPPADHDKPYEYGRAVAIIARLTDAERLKLVHLRRNAKDVKKGYTCGPAAGDMLPEPDAAA